MVNNLGTWLSGAGASGSVVVIGFLWQVVRRLDRMERRLDEHLDRNTTKRKD